MTASAVSGERRRECRSLGGDAVDGVPLEDVRQRLDRGIPARPDHRWWQAHGPLDRRGIPPDVAAVVVEDRAPPGERGGRIAIGIPDVGGLRDDAERPLLAAPPDRRAAAEPGPAAGRSGPRRGEPGPIDRHGLAVQQTSTDLCRLGESVDPLPERAGMATRTRDAPARTSPRRGRVPRARPSHGRAPSPSSPAGPGSGTRRRRPGSPSAPDSYARPTRTGSTSPRTPVPRAHRPHRPSRPRAVGNGRCSIARRIRARRSSAPIDISSSQVTYWPQTWRPPEGEAGPSQTAAGSTTAPIREEASAASSTRRPRIASSGSTGGGLPVRTASRNSS